MPANATTARRLRLAPVPPPNAQCDCRAYGPNEAPHPFAVAELVVYRGEGEATRVVRTLRACPGGFREVQP